RAGARAASRAALPGAWRRGGSHGDGFAPRFLHRADLAPAAFEASEIIEKKDFDLGRRGGALGALLDGGGARQALEIPGDVLTHLAHGPRFPPHGSEQSELAQAAFHALARRGRRMRTAVVEQRPRLAKDPRIAERGAADHDARRPRLREQAHGLA